MKPALLVLTGAVLFALGHDLHSQAPAAPQTPLQQMQAMKLINQQILERQAETLKKLEQLQLEAQQLKFFGKRA